MAEQVRVALIDADSLCHAFNWTYKGSIPKFEQAYKALKNTLRSIEEGLFCDYSLIAVKDVVNFRNDIYHLYKSKRQKAKFPTSIIQMLRDRLVEDGLAITAHGREADDLLRIWSNEAIKAGHSAYICSIDKDLDCIPGNHCNIKTEKLRVYEVTPKEAERKYWEQILQGDNIDNIPGLPGIGPKKAKAALANCTTTEEYKVAVAREYQRIYKDEWHEYLLANGKLIHLQERVDDYFSFDKNKYKETEVQV
jgi:5'-3' exonuclease